MWVYVDFFIFLTVHPNIMTVLFINLMDKFFILIHSLHSSNVSSTITLIFRRAVVLVQHLVSSLSVGDCSVHRLRESSPNLCTEQSPTESDDTRGSSHNLCTEQSPTESDDTRCCTNTTVLLKMSTTVLETCRGVK